MTEMVPKDVVIAVMAAIEKETFDRCVAACRAYAEEQKSDNRIATARAGAAGHLAKILSNMERKSK